MAEHVENSGVPVDLRERLESTRENLAILLKQTRGDLTDLLVHYVILVNPSPHDSVSV